MKSGIKIRCELQNLFRMNMKMIFVLIDENMTTFGKRCYVTRQTMANYFSDYSITPMDFVSMMYFAHYMIEEKPAGEKRKKARELYLEIWNDYQKNGLV